MNLTYSYLDPEAIIETDDFRAVEEFLRVAGRRNIGWHYIIDLAWIYSRARHWSEGTRVLDAGGGRGPVQFLLAEMGFNIINIDLVHTQPDYAYMCRYGTKRLALASYAETRYVRHIMSFGRYTQLLKRARKAVMESVLLRKSSAAAYAKRHDKWRTLHGFATRPVGQIQWLAGNLCEVPEMGTESFDGVVSLSSLEHVPLEYLPNALAEIRRMLRPNAYWAVTTSSTERVETWYHTQSMGYCFSQDDLVSLFDARPIDNTNPDDILHNYHRCQYLKDNLATNYRLSGKNGMPWGRWNPVYIPVGISETPVSVA